MEPSIIRRVFLWARQVLQEQMDMSVFHEWVNIYMGLLENLRLILGSK